MFNGSRKSVDKISGTFKDFMSKINSGSPSKGATASSSFDYDQLNDQIEKASLPSPDLPSPNLSGDSITGGFSSHPSFKNHQDADEVLEGFVCPLCLISFQSPGLYQRNLILLLINPLLQLIFKSIIQLITQSSYKSKKLNF